MKRSLSEQETNVFGPQLRYFVWGFFILGMLLLVADWYLRFARYAWHEPLLIQPPRAAPALVADRPPFATNRVASTVGGDLTALLAIPAVVDRFAEARPGFERITDREGYVNRPYERDAPIDAVVVGDSFMVAGSLDTQFASQLADVTGRTVVNRARMGQGPLLPLFRYLESEWFQQQPPRYLVWGFAEREIGGEFFERSRWRVRRLMEAMATEVDGAEPVARDVERPRGRVDWSRLTPVRLQRSLPDSSFWAQSSQWGWNRLRYWIFRQLHPWILASTRDVIDGPMLFYRYHVETLQWTEEERDAPLVADIIAELNAYLLRHQVTLIVLTVPEKEQVYRAYLPQAAWSGAEALPPSVLWDLERELRQRGVIVVNPLADFQQAAEAGIRTYWRDDTHWNDTGIGLAARRVAEQMEPPEQTDAP